MVDTGDSFQTPPKKEKLNKNLLESFTISMTAHFIKLVYVKSPCVGNYYNDSILKKKKNSLVYPRFALLCYRKLRTKQHYGINNKMKFIIKMNHDFDLVTK